MNLTHLKYFHAVATYHTVSGAAQHLYISQPSLSGAIKELEKEFAVSLFYRRHNGMFLTPEGTKLYNATKDLLSRFDEVESMMRGIGKNKKELRLGIPPLTAAVIFSDVYKNFVLKNTDLSLTITEKGRYELLDALNDGRLDVVLLPHTKPFDSSLYAKKIGSFEVVCWVGSSHPLAKREAVDAAALAGEPLVLFSDTFFQTKTIREWFASSGITPTVALQTEQLSTAQSMVENGLAAGFTFRALAEKNPAVKPLSLISPIYVDVSVIRKKDSYVFDAMRRIEEYFIDCALFED